MIHEMNHFKTKENDRYRGNGILIKSIVSFEYDVKNRVNSMKKELEYFNQKECEILMKLRTEYINLNQYLHYINYHPDGECDHCSVQETVSHFLIDCVGFRDSPHLDLHKDNIDFTIARKHLRNSLRKIAIFFKHEINFTAKNILFPHVWQQNPRYGDKNYKQVMDKNLKKRIAILKAVIVFVFETKRFKNNFGF